ncbi:MAG: CvpA family protein [Clostridia bacterium]|nr:CvpA family protein [Clostridia bacterium]MBQ3127602.1 CvpA family protein [Clostridia bacterium]MBQ7043263.1 CvpA family protein [Clostridia bacterium]
MEQYIIDIILAAIFLALTIKYFTKGFAKTILNFVAFFLSIVLSKSVSGTVTDWVFSNTKLFTGTERYIAQLIITVLCFVVLSVLLNWAVTLVNKFFKVPVLKQANKLLGGLLGALCGLMIVIVLCHMLQFCSHIIYNAQFVNAVESSKIVQLVLSDEKVLEGIAALK